MKKLRAEKLLAICCAILVLGSCSESPVSTIPASNNALGYRMSVGIPSVTAVRAGRTLPIAARPHPQFPLRAARLPKFRDLSPSSQPVPRQTFSASADVSPTLVWFAPVDGSVTLWEMEGTAWNGAGATILQIPSPWKLVATADLNGDDSPDLVWEATTDGTRAITFMNGGAYAGSYAMMFVIPTEWTIVAGIDFNGDNKDDLVLHNTSTGDNGVLYLNGTTWTGVFAPLPNFGSSSRLAAIADMNGDNKPDLVTQNTSTGQPSVYYLDGTTVNSSASIAISPGADWAIASAADFDLDGKNDLVFQNTSTGLRSIWVMNGLSRTSEVFFTSVSTVYKIIAAPVIHWVVPPPSIENIIVVTMENRSFDHFFGWVPGADGVQSGLSFLDGSSVAHSTYNQTAFDGCGLSDPSHSYEGMRIAYNGGANDGWLLPPGNDLQGIGYFKASQLAFLGQAAPQWTVLDRYFAPMMGPTFPNRIISLAGQTDRLFNDTEPSTLPTIWDRLGEAGLTGKNYGDGATTSLLWGDRYASRLEPMSSFFSDAAAGTLPNVSYIDPDFGDDFSPSDHPAGDIRNGEYFMWRIYDAVRNSPQWKSTVLIFTFDEGGGFFDHVAPGTAPLPEGEVAIGNDGLRGFRVPTMIVSPFARRGYVSGAVYDHASILKMIENRWGLESLAARDAAANDLMDELDLTIPIRAAPAITGVPAGPFIPACSN